MTKNKRETLNRVSGILEDFYKFRYCEDWRNIFVAEHSFEYVYMRVFHRI